MGPEALGGLRGADSHTQQNQKQTEDLRREGSEWGRGSWLGHRWPHMGKPDSFLSHWKFLIIHEELYPNCAVAHTCNPSYLGNWDWKDRGSRPAWANSSWDPPHLQNNQSKMDWRSGSSGRVPALWVRSPEFKLQFLKKKKERKLQLMRGVGNECIINLGIASI
jgi:hypothetical protein